MAGDADPFQESLELADRLLERARRTDGVDDLGAVVEHAQRALDSLDGCDARRVGPLYQLGLAHALRHERTGSVDDLRAAIRRMRAVRDGLADDDPHRPEVCARTGLLVSRYVGVSEGDRGDVDEAIRDLTAAGEADRGVLVRYALGILHAVRYTGFAGDQQDRETGIELLSELIERSETDAATADACRMTVAHLLLSRGTPVELRGRRPTLTGVGGLGLEATPEEIATARRHLESLTGTQDRDLAGMRSALELLVSSARGQIDLTAPEPGRALTDFEEMLSRIPDNGLDAGERDAIRAAVRGIQAHAAGSGDDLADGIAEAMAGLPAGHLMREFLVGLLRPGEPGLAESGDLERIGRSSATAVAALERALERLPADDPDRAAVLTRLVGALMANTSVNRGSMTRIRALAAEAIERGRADDENTGLNHAMLALASVFPEDSTPGLDQMDTAVEHLREAARLLPDGHALRDKLRTMLGTILLTRYARGSEAENVDAAAHYLRQETFDSHLAAFNEAHIRFAGYLRRPDSETARQVVRDLRRVIEELPEGHYLRRRAASTLSVVHAAEGFRVRGTDMGELSAEIGSALAEAGTPPPEALDFPTEALFTALGGIGRAMAENDLAGVDRGIALLGSVAGRADLHHHERLSAIGSLGMALRTRYEFTRDRRDLSNAIDRLEQARRMLRDDPGALEGALLLNSLADCYRARGDTARKDPQRAVRDGLESLRARARDVLLQSSALRALNAAGAALGEAASVARWCLAAGQPENAVEALELGRGMVLHAATVDAGVPAMLRESGQNGLADRWEREAAESGPQPWDVPDRPPGPVRDLVGAPLPSDLRYRVLEALEGHGAQTRLLSPPAVAEIAAALRATDTRALVYLVPAGEREPGIAVLVTDGGEVRRLRCPLLTAADGSPVDRFDRLQRERASGPVSGELDRRWRQALGEICDWAWTAVLGQVLDTVSVERRGRPSRIVLVPVGKLGAVPWHAARHPVPGGGVRYAFQDAVVRYAASARQFAETARRRRRAWDSEPALVRVAGSGLLWASEEIEDIHRRHYSHGVYLGRRRRGGRRAPAPRPDDVRALLPSASSPGASLLHLGCHADLAAVPVDSALRLGTGSALQVQDILRQARDRPADAPGGLVVLAACASDLTGREHDEALTLATAFLTAGAAGVVGARWNVDDLPTALIMIMFHHYLNSGYDDPATALRAAQAWMVDPRRVLPGGVGARLAPELATIDPAEPGNWAAFTYQGR
ncbi:CHAT domain-containing protein [Saccharopolyspora erythraea]|uniref:CHAT domain-containing protein n=1 Tax=Saccharopolyspora erythraea TaxID=1836 RepID=UPI001BA87127|nr:CHAT domain-containing protein [Saccharopolyspora erythraea]QUH03384.1 CHAT domain-containing protein [Saccharopolyspora erythraea]